MNSTEEQMKGSPRNAGRQRAGLVAMVCIVAAGWLAYFAITGLVLPASQVADEKGKIAGVEKNYASELANLKAEEAAIQKRGEATLAQQQNNLKILRQEGPQALTQNFAKSMVLEREAAAKLMIIFKANAEIQENTAPTVHSLLAENFTLEHTGATPLFHSLAADAKIVASEARRVEQANADLTPSRLQVLNRRLSLANRDLAIAIAASKQIVANIRGSVWAASSTGQTTSLANVRVTLVPRLISKTRFIRPLAAEAKSMRIDAQAVEHLRTVDSANYVLPIYESRTHAFLGYGNVRWLTSNIPHIAARLDKLNTILAKPPRECDMKQLYLTLWDYGDPLFYPAEHALPLLFPVQRPQQLASVARIVGGTGAAVLSPFNLTQAADFRRLFLPEGIKNLMAIYGGGFSATTGLSGHFVIRKVPVGGYYAYAFHSSRPFMVWLVPVTVTSRQTINIHLGSDNALEVTK